jgi:hypothetical protein
MKNPSNLAEQSQVYVDMIELHLSKPIPNHRREICNLVDTLSEDWSWT